MTDKKLEKFLLDALSDPQKALEDLEKIEARNSLDAFGKRMLDLTPARHHKFVNSKLEAVERGEIKRLMLFEPPGHAKSTWASWAFPAWYMGRNPNNNIILATHTGDFSRKWGRRVRNLLMSYNWPFEDVVLAKDSKAADVWEVHRLVDAEAQDWEIREALVSGEYFAIGVSGAVTGRRADLVIIDDPIKGREQADSETYRDSLWEWYRADLHTRLKPNARIVLIQTRWHEDDLAGRLLEEMKEGGEDWEVISLPALAEDNDPLGRAPGEALWPEWYTKEMLELERRVQRERNWAALYQQRPAPEEGHFFKREWIQYYDKPPFIDTLRIYAASDYAVSEDRYDWTVHLIIGVDPNDDIYILDLWRGQFPPDVWTEVMLSLMESWSPLEWGEEAGPITKAISPFLTKRMTESKIYTYLRTLSSIADKPTKAQAIRGRMAMGKVYFPKHKPWMDTLITELLTFPTGTHDDQVDALSMVGRMLLTMGKGKKITHPPPLNLGKQQITMDQLWKDSEYERSKV